MLRFLRIRDFALIRNLEVEFCPGLNLLTGETGSGKSILVDALGLLTGERSSQDVVRSGCSAAILEAAFSLESREDLSTLLEGTGIEPEEDSLLIRREISSTGRSRIFINNSLATLSLLKGIGEKLVDIYGQHDRQSLLDLNSHLAWLDRFGGNAALASEVRQQFEKLRGLAGELDSLHIDEQERLRRVDILQFQLDEIRKARLQPGELEQIQNERNIQSNRERILALSSEGHDLSYESSDSLLSQSKRLLKISQELEIFDPGWSCQRESLQEIIYKLEDVAFAFRDYASGIDFSSDRLNQIEQRIDELEKLSKKYGNSVEAIMRHAGLCEQELEALACWEDRTKTLTELFDQELRGYLSCAETLSQKRRKDAARLEQEIHDEFRQLSMEKMELSIRFSPRDHADKKAARIPGYCTPNGFDRVEFMVMANLGEDVRPLVKIASGGELSRIMLAIKSVCGGAENSRTLIFDEIDAGIGGRVAEVVGKRLKSLAQQDQVLCVTHLPQVAAFADHHLSVGKREAGARTETLIETLDEPRRLEELARMLGGETITDITRRHAKEMLSRSRAINNVVPNRA